MFLSNYPNKTDFIPIYHIDIGSFIVAFKKNHTLYILLNIFFAVFFFSYNMPYCCADVQTVEADGYYAIEDDVKESISVAKDRARLDALRNAVEKAGVYVESYSIVNNAKIANDEIKVIAGNIINVLSSSVTSEKSGESIVFKCHIVANIDTSNINLAEILNNRKLIEKNIEQEKIIYQLTTEINILKNNYKLAKNDNERASIQNAVYENEKKLETALVQLSDFHVEDFSKQLSAINMEKGIGLPIKKPMYMSSPEGVYDKYIIVAGSDNKDSCIIALYTNKLGFVSKLTIIAQENLPSSKINAYKMERAVLSLLGLEDSKIEAFMDDILSRDIPFGIAVWNNWARRNIAVEHFVAPGGLFNIRITAYDKLFPPERND